jgi:PAS domain S-box-containing protein
MNLRTLFGGSKQHYRILAELNPDITVVNCDGTIVYINQAGAQALGAGKPEELIGRSVLEFIHPDNQYVIRQQIPHPQNKGQTIPRAEEKLVRLDGSVMCVETTAMPITYLGRTATLVIGHDITARKNIEDKLAEQENQFRAFTESTPDAVLIVDYDSNILSWGLGAEKLFGYTKQEIIGKPSSLLLPAGSCREGHEQGVKLVHETASPGKFGRIFESTGIKKDGTLFPTEVSMSLFEATRGVYYGAVIIRDISARKQNEKLLSETNAFLNSIIENSPDGIVVANIDGVITRVNSWFEAALGFQKDEYIGKYILDFFPRAPDTYQTVTGDSV